MTINNKQKGTNKEEKVTQLGDVMYTTEKLLDIIRADINNKNEFLYSNLKNLISIIPDAAIIDRNSGTFKQLYLELQTEEAMHKMVNYIEEHINLILINYNNIVLTVYTQVHMNYIMYLHMKMLLS